MNLKASFKSNVLNTEQHLHVTKTILDTNSMLTFTLRRIHYLQPGQKISLQLPFWQEKTPNKLNKSYENPN